MQIALGNPTPTNPAPDGTPGAPYPGPAVIYLNQPDGVYTLEAGDPAEIAAALQADLGGQDHPLMSKSPDHEGAINAIQVWRAGHSTGDPSWVAVDGPDAEQAAHLQAVLAAFWAASEGAPVDVEDTHYTQDGGRGPVLPPGVGPDVEPALIEGENA